MLEKRRSIAFSFLPWAQPTGLETERLPVTFKTSLTRGKISL